MHLTISLILGVVFTALAVLFHPSERSADMGIWGQTILFVFVASIATVVWYGILDKLKENSESVMSREEFLDAHAHIPDVHPPVK